MQHSGQNDCFAERGTALRICRRCRGGPCPRAVARFQARSALQVGQCCTRSCGSLAWYEREREREKPSSHQPKSGSARRCVPDGQRFRHVLQDGHRVARNFHLWRTSPHLLTSPPSYSSGHFWSLGHLSSREAWGQCGRIGAPCRAGQAPQDLACRGPCLGQTGPRF